MNWYHSAAAVNALAGEYVLGTLQGRARRRFEQVMAQRADVAAAVQDWEQRLHRMASALPPVPPSDALWARLAEQAGLPSTTSPAARPRPRQAAAATPGLLDTLGRWLGQLLAPVPAGALAVGLMAGLVIPQLVLPPADAPAYDTALPESYVGVLATANGKPGLIVASLRHGRSVDLKQVSPVAPPPGQTLFLWTVDAAGVPTPVGAVPHGPFVQAPLADTAENVFRSAVELGVTFEPVGTRPAQPSGAWVYRGLCGKVWRAPPPAGAPR